MIFNHITYVVWEYLLGVGWLMGFVCERFLLFVLKLRSCFGGFFWGGGRGEGESRIWITKVLSVNIKMQ